MRMIRNYIAFQEKCNLLMKEFMNARRLNQKRWKMETVKYGPSSACNRNKQVECSPHFAFSCIGI